MRRLAKLSLGLMLCMGLLVLISSLHSQAQGFGDNPDLVIQDVQISPETLKPGEQATVTLSIANEGNGDVSRTAEIGVEFLTSFGPKELANLGLGLLTGIRMDKATIRGGLETGETTEVSFNWMVVELPKFQFIFKVDSPFDRVDEANEENNRTERTVRIGTQAINQWWLDNINASDAWETTTGSDEVTVAIIDTGMDISHTEFQGNLWTNPQDGTHGFDFIDDRVPSNRRTPIGVHGTSVGGLVAARDDGQGTTGVAPNVQLMDLRVFPTFRVGGRAVPSGAPFAAINRAIQFAVEHGADVINLSLGTSFCSVDEIPARFNRIRQELRQILADQRDIIRNAVSQGVVVMAAAGNNGRCVTFPAKFDVAIAIGATTKTNEAASFSSRGPEVWVSAPGGSLASFDALFKRMQSGFQGLVPTLDELIIAPYLRDNYGWFTGTSASTPIASGVVALMLSANPDMTPNNVRQVLAATATDKSEDGRDEIFGHGLINAKAAVECAASGLSCLE